MTTKFTADHEWINIEDHEAAAVGITLHAQDALGDVVFVDLPTVGATFNRTVQVPTQDLVIPSVIFNQCPSIPMDTAYTVHWWNDAVFYEIFVRSFQDSDGDGKGDFQGMKTSPCQARV